MRRLDVPVLIVGGGGAGLSASIILGDLGVESMLVERHPGTSHAPKAHYLNQRTMELFRQHGVAERVYAKAAPRECIGKTYWMTSVGGDGPLDGITYLEHDAMGGGPAIKAAYDSKGATHPTHIPQVRLEPVLREIAEERNPDRVLFNHELTSIEQDDDGVTAIVRNLDSGEDLEVRSQYLIGADAGKTVNPAAGITVTRAQIPTLEWVSVWVAADLSDHVRENDAVMRFIFHPGRPHRMGGLLAYGPTRWDASSEEWGIVFTPNPERPATDESAVEEAREFLGVDVPLEVRGVTHWRLETEIADAFSAGRVFIVGDAAHKHPPGAGLGLNSGIQDAHNLAWKLALVLSGSASSALLDTYEAERRPVVTHNSEWATFTMENYVLLAAAIGAQPGAPPEQNEAMFGRLLADTPMGATRRAMLHELLHLQRTEYAAHDMEVGFTYGEGAVVDDGSEPAPRDPMGSEYRPSSRPGSRLPHAWLNRDGETVSTHDLIPKGGFLLLTDPAGSEWAAAADRIAAGLGVPIRAVRVGPGGEVTDAAGDWDAVRGVDDGGAILARPDGHVAFRSTTAVDNSDAMLTEALSNVLQRSLHAHHG